MCIIHQTLIGRSYTITKLCASSPPSVSSDTEGLSASDLISFLPLNTLSFISINT